MAFPAGVFAFISAIVILVPSGQRCFSPLRMDFSALNFNSVGAPLLFDTTVSGSSWAIVTSLIGNIRINNKNSLLYIVACFIKSQWLPVLLIYRLFRL